MSRTWRWRWANMWSIKKNRIQWNVAPNMCRRYGVCKCFDKYSQQNGEKRNVKNMKMHSMAAGIHMSSSVSHIDDLPQYAMASGIVVVRRSRNCFYLSCFVNFINWYWNEQLRFACLSLMMLNILPRNSREATVYIWIQRETYLLLWKMRNVVQSRFWRKYGAVRHASVVCCRRQIEWHARRKRNV